MQTLALDNYGTSELSFDEQILLEGGGGPWWVELGKAIFQSGVYDAIKEGWSAADKAVGGKGGSGAYHDIMSSSNHGGIR
ncbi:MULTISPECIES: hypothetical protein [Emticicia]|uniref:hypothetical protein n=1 Tax=Emticicia TaxID=312278 RepID=UPI0007D8AB91|nr:MULTISPECIES: hypothetical protein [Emticicia]